MLGIFGRSDPKKRFADLVKRSGLVTDRAFADLAVSLNGRIPKHPQELADVLVDRGLLNQWQADNLLKGRYKGFFLGEYRLMGHLRTESLSTLYLATDPAKERVVAIKVLPKKYSGNEKFVERFKRESMAATPLHHPGIVRTFGYAHDGERHYIVMEYIDGRDLQQIIDDNGPLAATDVAKYIAQAALGLQHFHEAGIIHRDVKPANLVVDREHRIKLFDLGLSEVLRTR